MPGARLLVSRGVVTCFVTTGNHDRPAVLSGVNGVSIHRLVKQERRIGDMALECASRTPVRRGSLNGDRRQGCWTSGILDSG